MISNFADKKTEKLFNGKYVSDFDQVMTAARESLEMIEAAVKLSDLEVPPGNKLEALKFDRKGQYSIRINKQWRICFVWEGDGKGASGVEVNKHYDE
jgi:proteic killer suppression protein